MSTSLFVSPDDASALEGTLERVVYASADTGWTVARLETPAEAVTIVGNLAGVQPGESVRVTGRWVEDRRYGRQFRVESYLSIQPSTAVGIEKFLASGFVRGVGPVMARKLVQKFGTDTLRIIDEDASRLHEVAGLGRVRIAAIQAAWREQRAVRDVMVFLQSHRVSALHAVRIHKRYGAESVAKVRENPYRLARDIAGIGFLSADRIAAALGLAADAPPRLDAGVLYVLEQASEDGHCYVPRARLVESVAFLLANEREKPNGSAPQSAPATEAALAERAAALAPLVEAAIDRLTARGDLILEPLEEDVAVYEAGMHRLECAAANGLRRLIVTPPKSPGVRLDADLDAFERRTGLHLAPLQRRAVARALDAQVLVVTGGPGTGKTTLGRAVLHALDRRRERALLCAPTGRAAKRLAETTGQPAQTIHRLLEWSPHELRFQRDASHPLEANLIIADEVSMVDLPLFRNLVDAIAPGTRLLLVGDSDQLPSVGPGSVLADIIASRAAETVRLTDIYRQDAESRIVANAHRIRAGEPPELPPPGERADFVLVERRDPEELLSTLQRLVGERLPASLGVDPRLDVQVLVPMHRGSLGSAKLNAALREVLNPQGTPAGATGFQVGDKVMQVRNNYDLEVYNGDLGLVESWNEAERTLHVRFDDRLVTYEPSDVSELVLAYACTVHKSQGSEYPVVVVVLHRQHYVLLQRNLLYTAVTRARRQVIILGERSALQRALDNGHVQARCTRLAHRLSTGWTIERIGDSPGVPD